MVDKTSVFITGATGYIGRTVLTRLLNHPNATGLSITVLVRKVEKAHILESKFGVKAVVGSREQFDKVESLAEMGWKPSHTTEDTLKSIRMEVEEITEKPPRKPPFWPSTDPYRNE